jgi:hypothetical protein
MAKVPQTSDELRRHFNSQLQFLRRSAESFDSGFEDESRRLATTVRVLCHDTNQSRSLLGLLGIKDAMEFVDTSSPYNPANLFAYSGLVQITLRVKGRPEPRPLLDGGLFKRKVTFDDWWNGIVFVDKYRSRFSRKDLVLAQANKEGGAHVDALLDEDYARLTRDNSLGWYDICPPAKPIPSANQVPAAVRQIAHELIKALVPGYEKKPGKKPGDGVDFFGMSCVECSDQTVIPASNPVKIPLIPKTSHHKVGRNKPCPCGSGKKFKQCCGK